MLLMTKSVMVLAANISSGLGSTGSTVSSTVTISALQNTVSIPSTVTVSTSKSGSQGSTTASSSSIESSSTGKR